MTKILHIVSHVMLKSFLNKVQRVKYFYLTRPTSPLWILWKKLVGVGGSRGGGVGGGEVTLITHITYVCKGKYLQ